MQRTITLLIALTLLAAACSSDSDPSADDAATTTEAPASTTAPIAATTTEAETSASTTVPVAATTTEASESDGGSASSPLVIAAVDFEAGVIRIRNDGGEDYDLSGHWICNRPTYSELPGEVLAPGEVVEIDAAAIGLSADSGEIALYESSDFGNSDDIRRYVQWGTDSHGRTTIAVAGGVWQEGDFIDNQGGNIESTGSDPVSAPDWSST
ncbi:MAG: hypothetical protein ABFR53_00600 [Actinomycetota bacterium]